MWVQGFNKSSRKLFHFAFIALFFMVFHAETCSCMMRLSGSCLFGSGRLHKSRLYEFCINRIRFSASAAPPRNKSDTMEIYFVLVSCCACAFYVLANVVKRVSPAFWALRETLIFVCAKCAKITEFRKVCKLRVQRAPFVEKVPERWQTFTSTSLPSSPLFGKLAKTIYFRASLNMKTSASTRIITH